MSLYLEWSFLSCFRDTYDKTWFFRESYAYNTPPSRLFSLKNTLTRAKSSNFCLTSHMAFSKEVTMLMGTKIYIKRNVIGKLFLLVDLGKSELFPLN